MKAAELPKSYNPKDFEERIYAMWKEGGYFAPRNTEGADPFVVVIPPPNVTGVLHMGHGLNISLQDILVRYWRMKGRPALWIPGTDHAGIATQNVVERRLESEGRSRRDMGRDAFIGETWKLKEEHHRIITRQLEMIGASCDWSRERFTMDEGCSKAVREVFVSLYERGLVYRGEYMVNWCSSCGTALADDEVDYAERQGGLWEIRYPAAGGEGYLTVATTRPETMFGDTALAVHPEDERYRDFVGKSVRLPLTDRDIPVIADPYVDRDFGTGCLKVTPAHDPNDFEIGRRHNLPLICVIGPEGTMNQAAPEFVRGLAVKDAREAAAAELEAQGYLAARKDHPHRVGRCYRCSTVVEPLLSEQWFVRMKPMARKALAAWRSGEVVFHPKKWENTYRRWMENIRDWCVSRQIWWGHRIPAWTCRSCGELHVLREDPETCPQCGSSELVQDSDVLDTWFSSWTWPFSTLGWPDRTADLKRFYPTSTLITGYDIIFFWVARMIMAGMEFMGSAPFAEVYLTGLVRDKQGRKFSKSLGNGIDPLDVVDRYGSDAMKFTLAYLSAQGEDIPMELETNKLGSKFANKIWNAARFILMNVEELSDITRAASESALPAVPSGQRGLVDRWIFHRLGRAVKSVEAAVSAFRFDDMAHAVYEYFWNDFCDWYVECAKFALNSRDDAARERGASMLIFVLGASLKLLHPFLPFITEEIWGKLYPNREPLIIASYPRVDPNWEDADAESTMAFLQETVVGIRTLRSEFTIPPSAIIKVRLDTAREFDSHAAALAAMLVRSDNWAAAAADESLEGSLAVVGRGFTAHVYIKDMIDLGAAIDRFRRLLKKTQTLIDSKRKKLANEGFIGRAPSEIIEREKQSLAELEDSAGRSASYLASLEA